MRVPAEVHWLSWAVAPHWPDGDEAALRRCGQAWRDAAGALRAQLPDADRAGGRALAALGGPTADAARTAWDGYAVGDRGHVEVLAAACTDLAGLCDRTADVLEQTKHLLVVTLYRLAQEIEVLAALAGVTGGLSVLGMVAAGAAAQRRAQEIGVRAVTAIGLAVQRCPAAGRLADLRDGLSQPDPGLHPDQGGLPGDLGSVGHEDPPPPAAVPGPGSPGSPGLPGTPVRRGVPVLSGVSAPSPVVAPPPVASPPVASPVVASPVVASPVVASPVVAPPATAPAPVPSAPTPVRSAPPVPPGPVGGGTPVAPRQRAAPVPMRAPSAPAPPEPPPVARPPAAAAPPGVTGATGDRLAVLAPDRSDGTPGLLFGPARRSTGPATPDEDLVAALLARAAAAEARLTPVLVAVAERVGGELRGLEHRLKPAASVRRKLTEELSDCATSTAAEVLDRMKDAVRYTVVVPDGGGVHEALVEAGCRHVRYHFWRDGDQLFEVQVHTPESYAERLAQARPRRDTAGSR
jgi:hypothetical protein